MGSRFKSKYRDLRDTNLTGSILQDNIRVDSDLGKVYWVLLKRRVSENQEAGCFSTGKKYRTVTINGITCPEHHVIWVWETGKWPDELDHINGDSLDNRFVNLREATTSQNIYNKKKERRNRSGYKWVYWDTQRDKYRAEIYRGEKSVHCTFHDSAQEAYEAACATAKLLDGNFYNPN